MTKEEALQVIKTLSAIESWMFAQGKMIPDYLVEQVAECMKMLDREVLK